MAVADVFDMRTAKQALHRQDDEKNGKQVDRRKAEFFITRWLILLSCLIALTDIANESYDKISRRTGIMGRLGEMSVGLAHPKL